MKTDERPRAPRNLFEVDNARYLSIDEVVSTFVPTKSFWRLISAKNHIVLGARGSGKTAMLRMLSHDHLSRFNDARAAQIVKSRAFLGFYLPVKADWVGGLRNKTWLNESEKEELFRWRLNLASSLALVGTLQSCLNAYFSDQIERLQVESKLTAMLAKIWLEKPAERSSFSELAQWLADLDFEKQISLVRDRTTLTQTGASLGPVFGTELFDPAKQAIRVVSPTLSLPDNAIWMLCLDEAEALEPFHHRILNSYLRTHSGNLVFKMSTTPYGHYTLETNVGSGLSVGNDFEYVYIDYDLQGGAYRRGHFPKREADIFRKRARQSGPRLRRLTLDGLLGRSTLLDPQDTAATDNADLMREIDKFGDEWLMSRAHELVDDPTKFGNEIGRKIRGAIMLRNAVSGLRGQQEIDLYSGAPMVIRCCDGNPRRLIRLFNKLVTEGDWSPTVRGAKPATQPISPKRQTQILRNFSISALARVQGEPDVGPKLYEILARIGRYLESALHSCPLSADVISSIVVDHKTPDEHWKLVRAAVGIGLLYPNIHIKNPDEMPEGKGTFHLAYVLAPAFYLLPRRGQARRLETMLTNEPTSRPDLLPQMTLDF